MNQFTLSEQTLHGQMGAYRLYESIASGGFGSVSIGRDTATNVPVAIKRLHAHLKDEPGFVERFEQEASTVRGLAHPNIVRLLDQGRDAQGVPFLVMEWVEGLTIGDWLKRRGAYPPAEATEVACQVLEGLDAAWARRVVHRDIKPANLMVTPDGRVKIMDFGVAKDVDLATLAGSSGLIGTPAYMAPEQLRGKALDCRADLYALGVTLYVMLSGRPPFEGPSFADYFRQHLEEEPPAIEGVVADVDPGLAAVLRRALAKAPEDRFASPAEMLVALRSSGDEQTHVRAAPLAEATVVAPRRHRSGPRRLSAWIVAASLIGLVAVVGGMWLFAPQPPTGASTGPAATSADVTTPHDGTLYRNLLITDADAAGLRKTASPANYLIGRAPDNTYAIQKLLADNAAPATATLPVVASDGVLGVDVAIAHPAQTGVVLLGCRDQPSAGGRYQLALTPATGQVVLSQLMAGALRELGEPADASTLLHGDGTPDRLELECNGSRLSARVNGHEVVTTENADYPTGGWLIGAGAPGAAFEVHFTNLLVKDVSAAG